MKFFNGFIGFNYRKEKEELIYVPIDNIASFHAFGGGVRVNLKSGAILTAVGANEEQFIKALRLAREGIKLNWWQKIAYQIAKIWR